VTWTLLILAAINELLPLTSSPAAQLETRKMIRTLEHNRKEKRKQLCEAEGEIDTRRDDLTGEIEGQLSQQQSIEALFTVRWALQGAAR